MEDRIDNRLRTVAALAVLRDGGDAAVLADYMSNGDGGAFGAIAENYLGETEREFAMEQKIRQLVASEKFSSLAEVHPAWILERLKEEPPKVIGIVLRSLPSKHVKYIIKNLPPILRVQIPNMIESFAVRAPVLEVIRRRFERHFQPMPVSRASDNLGFSNLYYLKGEELLEVIRELGLYELAIAFAGMGSKALHAIYNRLDLKDAKRLQRRIRELKDISPELHRQARYTVLEVEGKHMGPDKMLLRIGLAALANAMEDETGLNALLTQKLSPEEGYMLKRLIDERRMRKVNNTASERKNLILEVVAALASESRIDPFWAAFGPRGEAPIEAAGHVSHPVPEDETITSQQLA